MKNSVYPKFLLDLNEDSGILQWPIGRKMFQKLEILLLLEHICNNNCNNTLHLFTNYMNYCRHSYYSGWGKDEHGTKGFKLTASSVPTYTLHFKRIIKWLHILACKRSHHHTNFTYSEQRTVSRKIL